MPFGSSAEGFSAKAPVMSLLRLEREAPADPSTAESPVANAAITPDPTPHTCGGHGRNRRDRDARLEPLLIPAEQAAELLGISKATLWKHHASRLCPSPVRLGHRTLWRLAELKAWVAAGCPPRVKWNAVYAKRA